VANPLPEWPSSPANFQPVQGWELDKSGARPGFCPYLHGAGTNNGRSQARPKNKVQNRRKKAVRAAIGAPSHYTNDIGNEICAWIAEGNLLADYCAIPGKPTCAGVQRWLWPGVNEEFATAYTRAREAQAAKFVEETIKIADTVEVGETIVEDSGVREGKPYTSVKKTRGDMLGHRELKIKARQWAAPRYALALFGGDVTPGPGGRPLVVINANMT
jgi:hypothetical protein